MLAQVIRDCGPDLVVLQEATRPDVVARLASACGMTAWGAEATHSVGFMSRVPIAHHEWHRPGDSRRAFLEIVPAAIPVRVFGTYAAFGRHLKFPRPRRVAVKYGEPLWFETLRAEAKTCSKPRLKQIYQEVADEIMAAIAKLEPCEDKEKFP